MDVIIGGGITGLSYAAFTSSEYVVLERENELGGYCRTIKQDGFVWDYSGHFFHFRDPQIKAFVLERMDERILHRVQKRTQIYYNGHYIDFPFQMNIHQLPKEEFIDCLCDLFAAEEYATYDTFKGMVYRNFGAGIANRFLIPYNEKLYACDLNHLDSEAMGRFFPKASPVEIVRNFRKQNHHSYNDSFVYSEGGAASYVESIVSRLDKAHLRLNSTVKRIDMGNRFVYTSTGEKVPYKRLISTVPFPELMHLCGYTVPPDVLTANQVVVFNLGFDTPSRDRENSWVYVPGREWVFYRVGYYSNIIPAERMSLYVEVGTKAGEFIDEQQLLARVLADLQRIGIVEKRNQLVSYSMVVMNPAYVHINQAGNAYVAKMKEKLEQQEIYSIGRYGSWVYCSIEDNIKEAQALAMRLHV